MSIRFLYNLGLAPFTRGRDFPGDALSWPISGDILGASRPGTFVYMAGPDAGDTGEPPETGAPKPDDTKKTETGEPKKPETEGAKETAEKPKAETPEEKKAREIDEIRRRIHERIEHTLNILYYYRETAPTPKEKRPFSKWIDQLEKINDEDLDNEDAIKSILHALYQKNNISLDDATKIITFNAAGRKECKKTIASLPKVPSYEKKQIFRCKTHEFALEERFDKIFAAIVDHTNRINRFISDHFEKEHLKEGAANSLGINLKQGTKIEYTDPRTDKKSVLEIASVKMEKKKIKLGKNREDEVWEPMEITTKDGKVFSLARLDKFLKDNDGHEVIENKIKLEEAIGWNLLGIKIEAGMEIEYDAGDPDDPDKYIPRRVKILEVTDKEITLENEVLLNKDADERKDKLSLGEFAMWMRKTRAQKAIDSIDELREILITYSQKYAEQHHLKPELYPPIEVKKGEKVYTGGDLNNVRQIKDVTTDTVELQNGDKMTFARFLRWVLDHHAQKFDPKNEGEKWKKTLEEAGVPKDDAEAAAKKREEELKKAADANDKDDKDNGKEPPKPPEPPREHAPIHSNAIREWWLQTTWIGPNDIWHLVKSVYEYIGRRHERNTKRRFSAVGKHLPTDVKYEFERINHEAEHEEVHKYQEPMKTMSILHIQHILDTTSNKDQMKACFYALSEKGQLRWDDEKMWANLNKFLPGHLMTPPKKEIDKLHPPKTALTDYLPRAIDYLWGESTFSGWHSGNNSQYTSKKKAWFDKGDQYEGSPDGVGLDGAISKLLARHKAGEWVDPQEYEGLIDFSMTKGKSTNEHRLYFLLEGVTAVNPHTGLTLISLDRLGSLDGTFLNAIPWLDYLTGARTERGYRKGDRYLKQGIRPEKKPWTVEDLREITEWWSQADDAAAHPNEPNSRTRQFLFQFILPNSRTDTRAQKGMRKAHDMDHDDIHVILPLATESQIQTALQQYGGQMPNWSDLGRLNGYAGFSQFIKSMGEIEEEDLDLFGEKVQRMPKLEQTIKSFVRFDTISNNIFQRDNNNFNRIEEVTYQRNTVVDPRKGGEFRKEIRDLLKEICTAYEKPELYSNIYDVEWDETAPDYEEKKKKVDGYIRAFSRQFSEMVGSNPKLLLDTVQTATREKRLLGMGDFILSKTELEKRRKAEEERLGIKPGAGEERE